MKVEVKSVNERRCRSGRCFTQVPEYFDKDAFTDEQWKAINDDPMLSLRSVSDEEAEKTGSEDADDDERIASAISDLDAGGFSANGQPKVGAVNAALKAAGADLVVNASAIGPVFAAMLASEFTVPVEG